MKNIWLSLAVALSAHAAQSTHQSSMFASCPASLPFAYVDRAHGFHICLPAGLTKQAAEGYPSGAFVFTGFAVPANTNLKSKRLIIIPDEYDLVKNAAPFGHFVANGLTFERTKFEEGSAGHLTLHVIYTWKHGNSAIHFDFEHRSVNVMNFDSSARPAEYDRAAQIKITEQIMSTFKIL